jgi:hypothetical protein
MLVPVHFQSEVQKEVNSESTDPINETASGIIGLTSQADRNITANAEYTQFTDSALVRSEPIPVVDTHVDDLEDTASVISFLQRPCLLWYAVLKPDAFTPIKNFASLTGWAQQPFIKSFNVPNDTMKFGKRLQKLENFQWFKADVVFRIMTNVNPFVAGRLWACFAPYDDDVEPQCSILNKSRAGVTSYPGVEIDLQSANAAEIRIPWSGLGDAFSLTTSEKPVGKFYLFSLTPALAQGSPDIPIQVFSWFENVSINAPTPISVTLQAAKEAKGPITEVSGVVKTVADVLAPLPVVGTVASTVSWVAGAVNKVASIFGWSRPVEGSGAPALSNIPGRGYSHFKCEDQSTMLAFANDNSIAEKEVNFLQNVDEMSIEHISSRPAMISSVQWGRNSVPLAGIGVFSASPRIEDNRHTSWVIGSSVYNVYDLTLFELLSTRFGLWKADVHFRISVVRTPFHVGRFEVFFVPYVDTLTDVESIDSTNLYRHIVDITETNEIEFVVPYMHQNTMTSSQVQPTPYNNKAATGVIVIRALSPLSAPDTVSNFVSINVWKWATNVSFACPVSMGTTVPDFPVVNATLQGIVRNEEQDIQTIVFGKNNSSGNALDACQVVAGEMCFNLRQATRAHRLFPNQIGDKTLLNTNVIGGFGGFVGLSANIFAFYRGGLSYKLVPTSQYRQIDSIRTTITRTFNNKPASFDACSHTTYPRLNPFHEVQVPFYSQTRRGLCNRKIASMTADDATEIQPGVYVQVEPDNPLEVWVGGKDDLTFGYLIGSPIYALTLVSPTKPFKEEEVLTRPGPDFLNVTEMDCHFQSATTEKTRPDGNASKLEDDTNSGTSRVPNVSFVRQNLGSSVCKQESRPVGVKFLPQVEPQCPKGELKHCSNVAHVTTPCMDALTKTQTGLIQGLDQVTEFIQPFVYDSIKCDFGCCKWSKRNLARWGKRLSYYCRHDKYLERIGNGISMSDVTRLLWVCSSTVFQVIARDNKGRFTVSKYGVVTAKWGHSIPTQEWRELSEAKIAYHSTTIAAKGSIEREGIRRMNREFVHMASTPEGTRCRRPVLYEIDLEKLQDVTPVWQVDNVILAKKVPLSCLKSVTIYGRKFDLSKKATLQGLGDYNPFGLVKDSRRAIQSVASTSESIQGFVEHGKQLLETVTQTLEQAKLTLFGASVQGVITKVFKILCNALMSKRHLLPFNLLFNVSMEFGAEVYGKIKQMLGLNASLQSGIFDMISLGKFGEFIDSSRGVCAAGLGALLAIIFQCCLGMPRYGNIDHAIKFFGDRSRGLKNIFDFASVTLPLFTAIGGYLISCQFGTEAPELDEYLSGYKKWSEEIVSLVTDNPVPFAIRVEKDVKLVFQVDRLYKQSVEYASTLNSKGIRGPSVVHYQKMSKIIEELRKQCDYTGVFGNRPRVKPLVVHLFGESGVGKSGMSWPLSCDLNAAFTDTLENAKNFSSEIYFRNTEQEFWDGYAGQSIVVYDDFGQRTDTSAAPNEEFMELIRAANLAPYPLHMADLPEKKRTKFCSKAIILTSNVLEQNVSSLTFPDAYRRRIDICGKVENKKEYSKECRSLSTGNTVNRLDTTKCDGPVDTKPYVVKLYDPESQQPICDPTTGATLEMDYDQFLTECLRIAKISFKNSQAVNGALEDRMTEERFSRLRASLQSNTRVFDLDDEFEDAVEELDEEEHNWRKIAADITKKFTIRMSELMTVKNALIVAGLVIAGLGAWKWMGGSSKNNHHDGPIYEARSSGDGVTIRTPVLKTEACASGDNMTKKNATMIHESIRSKNDEAAFRILEAASSADNVTKNARVLKHEAFSSSDNRTNRAKTVRTESNDVTMQVWKDASAQDLITHRIISNLYKIIRIRSEEKCAVLNGIFVRDNIMLAPKHLMLSLLQTDEIILENALGTVYRVPVNAITIAEVDASNGFHKDAILMQFPRYVAAHSDIVKHFQTMPELAVRRVDVCVPTLRSLGSLNHLMILGNVRAECEPMILNTDQGTLRIRDAIKYTLNTRDGDCGAPVICQENTMIRKIAGIHIAAFNDGSAAVGQSITRADLERTLDKFHRVVVTDNDELPGFALRKFDVILQNNVEYGPEQLVEMCGSVAASFGFVGMCETAPYAPNKSDIRPSVIHGEVTEPITMPSCLHSSVENVMKKNMGKNALNTGFIPREEVQRCVNETKVHLLKNRDLKLARILTYEEAVSGSEDSVYMSGLNRGSSAGFPWVLSKKPGTHGKTGWFGDADYIFDEEVRSSVEHRIIQAKNGRRSATVWTDTLKDERRPVEKVQARKTRVFANGPMDYTIAFRMYFLGFIAHIMENRIWNEQSLGTNPYGNDWGVTAKKLSKFGKKVFAGDFSSFDGTLNSCIMEHFVEVANEFYNDGEENAKIRRILFLDVFNSIHLCQGVYIYLTHSQPSGNPATTALNSFYNSVSMRIAYYRAARKARVTPPLFDEAVSMVSYGDDNVINFSDSVSEWFNQQEVTEAYATFGMIYTDEAKSGGIAPKWRSLEEVAYLKRGFRYTNGIWRAPMDLKTILETPNWIRKCPDEVIATCDNLEDSCRELAQHERAVFDQWVPKLIEAFYNKTGEYPLVYTYDAYCEEWNREMGLLQ